LVFETYCAEAVEPVLREVKAAVDCPVPILVSLWRWPDPPEAAARRLVELGAAVVGINCQSDLGNVVALCRRLHGAVPAPRPITPSATAASTGQPEAGSTPADFAEAVRRLLDQNVRLFGGCCGTTESHIAALAAACSLHQYPLVSS